MDEPLGAREYHERTKHSPRSVRESGRRLDFDNKPSPYKRYRDLHGVSLPDDPAAPAVPALEAIAVSDPRPPVSPPFPETPGALDRETLASLCHHACGVTKHLEFPDRTKAFRAAACTGALYHVDCYPVCGPLGDLDAGVYHYDPEHHRLDVLRPGDRRDRLAEATGSDRVRSAPVTVVTTSTWWRNAWKYAERTFRHAFWDSGTVVANLLATAHGFGLPAEVELGFADEPVVELLGLDVAEEAPLELVTVGEGSDSSTRDAGATDEPEPSETTAESDIAPIDPDVAPYSPDPVAYPAIPAAWRAGVLDDGGAAAAWRETATETGPVGRRAPGDGERIPLDPVDRETASARPLGTTIQRRGSCREYAREDLSFRKLSTVLDRAFRGLPLALTADHDAILSYNDPYLLVNGIEGLESGVYQYHPEREALEQLRAGECRDEAGHLALGQRLGADAAVCAYFMTDLGAVVEALGDRGYRAAQFEAALTAGRLYLATYAHRDLGGTGLTFFDDAVTDFLSPRAAGQTPTFLYTLGRPA